MIDTFFDLRTCRTALDREDLHHLEAAVETAQIDYDADNRTTSDLPLRRAIRAYAQQALMGTAGDLSGADWLRIKAAAEWVG